MALITGSSLAGYYLFKSRTKFHWYHIISLALRGDVALQQTLALHEAQFVPPDWKAYANKEGVSASFALKWRFRPSHAVPTDPMPAVDDADGDGVPEVYIASYSKDVYALDGRTGKTLWTWKLPFGVVGGRSIALVRLEHYSQKVLIVGTHTTLPIRVYALKVEKNLPEADRLLWVRNVSGDFIEGGLNVFRSNLGATRVVAAARDAPYSRGSLNILDERGNFVIPPIEGLDDCRSRPSIGDLNGDGKLDLIYGSHSFYKAKYGSKIVALEAESGRILWKRSLDFDTGFTNHVILDHDGDGTQEVLAIKGWSRETVILNGVTGETKRSFPLLYQGYLKNESGKNFLLMKSVDNRLVLIRPNGTTVYELSKRDTEVPFGQESLVIRLKGQIKYSLLIFSIQGGKLILDVHDFETGRKKERYELDLDPPPEGPGSIKVWVRKGYTAFEWGGFETLADIDADGFWEVLFLADDYVYAIDTPFEIAEGYHPYAPIPQRNINNAGVVFTPDKEVPPLN